MDWEPTLGMSLSRTLCTKLSGNSKSNRMSGKTFMKYLAELKLQMKRARTNRLRALFPNVDSELHQKFIGLAGDGMLHLFQFIFDLVQAIHQPFEFLRHAAEERSHLGVLKVFEL